MLSTEAEALRGARIVAILGAATLVLAACGDDDPDEAATQERIDELEAELEETRQDNEELLAENERLHEELRLLAADDPDSPDDGPDTEDPDENGEAPDDEAPDDGDADADPPADGAAEPQPIRSPEGLNEQLRMLFDQDGPEEWEPGTTEWTSASPPDGLGDSYDSPGELAFALAAELDAQMLGMDSWETTTRVLMDDDDPDLAYVAVLSWGFADDSVAGRDLRMTITATDGAWSPGGAEERFHCYRGVADDLCV